MAFAEQQLQIILHRLPDADGTISIRDAGHILGGYLTQTTVVSLGGSLTPFSIPLGVLGVTPTFAITLDGELDLAGVLSVGNPAWLLIDDKFRWMGEWVSTIYYDEDDVVLYKSTDGIEWHVFISKVAHNMGNIPTSSAAWWRRLYQEPLL